MSLITSLKMEVAELLWPLPRSTSARSLLAERREQFLADGYCVLDDFLDPQAVDRLAAEAHQAYVIGKEYVSHESNGSDERIYGVDRLAPAFVMQDAMRSIDAISRAFYWPFPVVLFQMLGRIQFTANNAGSGSGWHRDSPFSHQFKAILYLSDVDDDNGPFQYIRGSHRKAVVKDVARALGVSLNQYRFSSEQIDGLERSGVLPPRTTFVARKGTLLLADTRGLHRGKPLHKGERLAVTRYYFARRMPAEFTSRYALTAR